MQKTVTPGSTLPNRVPRTQMSNRASLNRIRVPYSCSCDKSKAPYTIGVSACLCRMTLLPFDTDATLRQLEPSLSDL